MDMNLSPSNHNKTYPSQKEVDTNRTDSVAIGLKVNIMEDTPKSHKFLKKKTYKESEKLKKFSSNINFYGQQNYKSDRSLTIPMNLNNDIQNINNSRMNYAELRRRSQGLDNEQNPHSQFNQLRKSQTNKMQMTLK